MSSERRRALSAEGWAGANGIPYEFDEVAQTLVAKGPLTDAAIGRGLGLTRERVRQIGDKALELYLLGMIEEGWTQDELADQLAEWARRQRG